MQILLRHRRRRSRGQNRPSREKNRRSLRQNLRSQQQESSPHAPCRSLWSMGEPISGTTREMIAIYFPRRPVQFSLSVRTPERMEYSSCPLCRTYRDILEHPVSGHLTEHEELWGIRNGCGNHLTMGTCQKGISPLPLSFPTPLLSRARPL